MDVDATGWSGEGEFTATLVAHLRTLPAIAYLRIEDAPASHTEANYNFISNEIYLRFQVERVRVPKRLLGMVPVPRTAYKPVLTLDELERQLAASPLGPPDYADEAMLQYLKTERIIPAYQTRGHKVIELVRIYRLTT